MKDAELEQLEALATRLLLTSDGRPWVPGPWTRGEKQGNHRNCPIYIYDDSDCRVAETDSEEGADYLAALSPVKILSLLQRLSEAEQRDQALSDRDKALLRAEAAEAKVKELQDAWDDQQGDARWAAE